MSTKLLLGPPGTGKTTRLLEIVEQEMEAGVAPDEIAFVSFTRKAADEAADRAAGKFNLDRKDLPYFRTLHSLAFNQLGISREAVMTERNWTDFGELMGLRITGDNVSSFGSGDKMLHTYNLARARGIPLQQAWNALRMIDTVDWYRLEHFARSLERYKDDFLLWDFSDMIQKYPEEGQPLSGIKVVIIDEAQDLSTIQWRMADYIFQGAERVYIAGDDDQAIYRWAGADTRHFLSLDAEREVLGTSYRLPEEVWKVSQKVVGRIQNRYEKSWKSREEAGSVEWIHHTLEVQDKLEEGSWLFLLRNVYQIPTVTKLLRDCGVLYTHRDGASVDSEHVTAILAWGKLLKGEWIPPDQAQAVMNQLRPGRSYTGPGTIDGEGNVDLAHLIERHHIVKPPVPWYEMFDNIPDARIEYYRSCLRKGIDLRDSPEIHVDTIHGVKGGEADNVVLFLDHTNRTHKEYRYSPDDEHRVFYVGATRTRHNLYLKTPSRKTYYNGFAGQ